MCSLPAKLPESPVRLQLPKPSVKTMRLRSQETMVILKLFCFISHFLLFISIAHATSGFYTDNGEITEMNKKLSTRQKREVQEEILSIFGLHHPPRPIATLTKEAEKASAPKFLKEIYYNFVDEETGDLVIEDGAHSDFNITKSDIKALAQSDTIMSFMNRGHHLHSIRHGKGVPLWFDLSEIPENSVLVGAELRLFRQHRESDYFSEYEDEDYEEYELLREEDFTIQVYQVLPSLAGTDYHLELILKVNTTDHDDGSWIPLNLTNTVKEWIENPDSNFGLMVIARGIESGRELPLANAGVVSTKGKDGFQPFMVAFFQSLPALSTARIERTKRAAKKQEKKTKDNRSYPDEVSRYNPYAYDYNRRFVKKSCQKKNLYVNFRDLGWQEWIIAPEGYAAFYCNGDCSFPLNAHMNATNHAIVQTLVHLLNPSRVPRPCCAPTKLSSISVLYFDDSSNVILKKYRNMVVKSCGCH
ncbi:protein 60A-like [Artemia franciscana]|uniref:TGF-beta family profile domain-containing protein n=1 Tax=Artemia franciscana TaxID=6661 RepID=A0AA88L758_ARTSF|nr:hypothetical protein QYM36_004732 [Artemia franciscana]